MFVRNLQDFKNSGLVFEWCSGTSHRLLTESNGMGYGVCHTMVRAGTESLLEYRNHLEACYCISGEGDDVNEDVFQIRPGTIYVLNKHDRHYLRGGKNEDSILVSVFNPSLKGRERHNLESAEVSTC